jgi:hypothetical protein
MVAQFFSSISTLPPSPQGVRSLPLLLGDSIPVPSWYEFLKKIQYQYQLECSKVDTCPILVCTLQHLAGQIPYQYQAGMHLKKKRSYANISWYVQKLIPAQYWFGVWTTLAGRGDMMITTRFEG